MFTATTFRRDTRLRRADARTTAFLSLVGGLVGIHNGFEHFLEPVFGSEFPKTITEGSGNTEWLLIRNQADEATIKTFSVKKMSVGNWEDVPQRSLKPLSTWKERRISVNFQLRPRILVSTMIG